jgi:NADPH2:quinone reductase
MTQPGPPEVLTLGEVPKPRLQTGTELLVRLKATGINPVDTKLRARGTYFPDRLPTILGCDGAGIVEEAGAGAKHFKPGDEVYFCNGGIGGHPGNYAQYATVDERYAARKPAALSFEEAAAVPLALITAWESLHDRGRLQNGQHTIIHAGAGGVGHLAIQLARLQGAQVCTTVGSQDKAAFVRWLGADEIILYKEKDFVQAINAWTRNQGVDLALDTVGGKTFQQTFHAVRYGGDVVTLLQPDKDTDWKEARLRNLRISLELMLTPMLQGITSAQQHHADILTRCATWFDSGKLRIHLHKTFPLVQAAEAHRLIEAGSVTGKIALVIPD